MTVMPARVQHFEIPTDDIARAQSFYKAVFDFGYEPWGDDMGMLRTGATDDGIDGDLHERGPVAHPTIVVTVDSIEETLALVLANGGEQVGEIQAMGETARYAYIRDSEGNIIGLYDDVESAS